MALGKVLYESGDVLRQVYFRPTPGATLRSDLRSVAHRLHPPWKRTILVRG